MRKATTPVARRRMRHERTRKRVSGTDVRPRLCVFRSSQHIYAQVIDDVQGHTLAAASSLEIPRDATAKRPAKASVARQVGLLVAQKALSREIRQVVFDRGGYPYHGRIKALAEAAREGGLSF